MDSMVAQHLDLYDWGTSNPTYGSLESGFVQSRSTRGPAIVGVGPATPSRDATVGGVYDNTAFNGRLLTELNCGEGSYLERVSEVVFRSSRYRRAGRAMELDRRQRLQPACSDAIVGASLLVQSPLPCLRALRRKTEKSAPDS